LSQSLVNKQHVLPAKSIERFCNSDGNVQVRRLKSGNTFPAKPNNNIFCVTRIWDQRCEQGYGKGIEDRFQELVEYVLANKLKSLPLRGHKTATEFYALWCLRSSIKSYDKYGEGILLETTDNNLSEEQKIAVELKHSIYIEPNGVVPDHFKRGLTIQIAVEQFVLRNPQLKWSICCSDSLEFIVSDNPEGEFIIPITPKQCFICGFDITQLSSEQMTQLNLNALARSKEYYFACDLGSCIRA
tara:strand:- start:8263 stop:8991 length:729 start_codon:yes stop_codon:yes gene_type:complete